MLPETEQWVREFLLSAQQPGTLPYDDISQATTARDGSRIACTVLVRTDAITEPTRQVAIVDVASGEHRLLDLGNSAFGAAWSPRDDRLAVIVSTDEGDRAVVVDPDELSDRAEAETAGSVEHLHWSPDGSRLALQVAEPGAELSDLYGSGVVGGAESWRPRVLPSRVGRRMLVVWSPTRGTSTTVGDRNVWEAGWHGPDRLVAIASNGPGEDDWYHADLVGIDAATGQTNVLLTPPHQLSRPCAAPSGERWAVVSGAASDRDLLAGTLVVGAPEPRDLDTGGVHVTDAQWIDEQRVLVAGLRGTTTVVAAVDTTSGVVEELWAADEQTTGQFMPTLGGLVADAPVLVREQHVEPPTLGIAQQAGFAELVAPGGPGVEYRARQAGTRGVVQWAAPDGTSIEGYLTVPDGPRPHPLVVDVHGGPIHAVRNTWAGRDPYVSLLVARGYAVLQPNPRGSTGHGAAYAEAVIGDMGGADADDIISGVHFLVERGDVDGERVGLTGVSYGGFMTAWLPTQTDVFRAGVSRSPCTDWNLMYLTSNIREFVRIFVAGRPGDPQSQYLTRSPLQLADRVTTPLLFTTGSGDLACPSSQAHTMYTALAENGVAAELVVYPEEGHDVKAFESLVDQCARMIDWFERFMPTAGSPQD